MGSLQFAMSLLQLHVGGFQSLGRDIAEDNEDEECRDDDADDDEDIAVTFLLLLQFQVFIVETGIHLRQLLFDFVGVNGVVDGIHLTIETCSLLISTQALQDLCPLLSCPDHHRLVIGVHCQPHNLVVEG